MGWLYLLLPLLKQRWNPLPRLQVSDCSTLYIMCNVESTAACCSESIECFPVMASKYSFEPFVTLPEAPNYDRYNHTFLAAHSFICIHELLNLIYFLLPFAWHLSAGIATSISMQTFSACFLIIKSGLFFVASLFVLTPWFQTLLHLHIQLLAWLGVCVCVCVSVFHFAVISMPSASHIE
jgi:hypothetical protein